MSVGFTCFEDVGLGFMKVWTQEHWAFGAQDVCSMVSVGFTELIDSIGGNWLSALFSGFGMGRASLQPEFEIGVFCFFVWIYK